jgi:hypothetical protein
VSLPNGTYTTGTVGILQTTGITRAAGTTVQTTANGSFVRVSGLTGTVGSTLPAAGSCIILVASNVQFQQTGLDAGSISVNGGGTQTNLAVVANQKGLYSAMIPAIPANGQSYTFTGAGGLDVGAFSTNLNFPPPLVWTNQPSITTVNRAQGQLITWSGGAKGTYVRISGQSAVAVGVGATFLCVAPVDDGQFMVPSWILLALPPNNNGALNIQNYVYGPTPSVPNLDYFYTATESITDKVVTYQ